MPTSPEGVSEILRQLSHVSAHMGRYQISLDAQTRAVEGLHQEVSELRQDVESIKGTLAEKAIKEAEARGREQERERLRKYTSSSTDNDSGSHNRDMIISGQRVKAQRGITAVLSPRELILILIVLAAIATGDWSWVKGWFSK